MSKNNDREMNGPELDNQLIRYVKEYPAIYDVSHPHYRRNPVRIAIWDRIASEMNTTSRFLQTKWKNIRYNYLQEQKSIETGKPNPNVRRRRFTEDLSFLQNTVQLYNVKKVAEDDSFIQNAGTIYKHRKTGKKSQSYTSSSDTEDNSCAYGNGHGLESSDIIEIDHSNDSFTLEEIKTEHPAKKFKSSAKHEANVLKRKEEEHEEQEEEEDLTPLSIVQGKRHLSSRTMDNYNDNVIFSPNPSYCADRDNISPLLAPVVIMNDEDKSNCQANDAMADYQVGAKSPLPQNTMPENLVRLSTLPTNHDSSHLYCLSLVDSFRNMPRSERERVKYEFAKILKEVKYKDEC